MCSMHNYANAWIDNIQRSIFRIRKKQWSRFESNSIIIYASEVYIHMLPIVVKVKNHFEYIQALFRTIWLILSAFDLSQHRDQKRDAFNQRNEQIYRSKVGILQTTLAILHSSKSDDLYTKVIHISWTYLSCDAYALMFNGVIVNNNITLHYPM
jgi:hypothetical protein